MAGSDRLPRAGSREAADAGRHLVADVVTVVANQPDVIVEDALCMRLGTVLSEAEQAPLDDRPGPSHLAPVLVTAAQKAVETTIGDADAWRAPWQVLSAVATILPYPYKETAADAITLLRAGGENEEQFAEYHHSKRLTEAVTHMSRRRGSPPDRGLNAATAAVEFATWLRGRATDQEELPEDLNEVAAELAERCLPYAQGQPHPQIMADNRTEPDYLACVIE